MDRDILKDRESAFEFEFFHKVDVKLMEKIKEELANDKERLLLSEQTGITNDDLLCELLDLGINHETILALSLMPLVRIAWADGTVSESERETVLAAAKSAGKGPETPTYRLLESWLEHLPAIELYGAWKDYIKEVGASLSETHRIGLKQTLSNSARKVATAAGGIFGLARVSAAEQEVIDDIEASLRDL